MSADIIQFPEPEPGPLDWLNKLHAREDAERAAYHAQLVACNAHPLTLGELQEVRALLAKARKPARKRTVKS